MAERRQHRPLDQEIVAVDVQRLALARLADGEHLAGIVPLVERRRGVDAFEALEPDEPPPEDAGECLRRLGLADARRAFQQQRLAERERQERRGGNPVIGQIERRAERIGERLRAVDAVDRAQAHAPLRGPGRAPPLALIPRRTFSGVIGRSFTRTPTAL